MWIIRRLIPKWNTFSAFPGNALAVRGVRECTRNSVQFCCCSEEKEGNFRPRRVVRSLPLFSLLFCFLSRAQSALRGEA